MATVPVEFFATTADSDFDLDDRLRFLLGTWRRERPWDRADPFRHEFAQADADSAGVARWRELLAAATPIPPRTYLPGLKALLFAHNHPDSVEALEAKGIITVRGDRVAFEFGARASVPLPHPDGWSLLLPPGATRGLEGLLALRFKECARTRCGEVVSGGMSSDEWRDVTVLLNLVLDATDPQLVFDTWAKSRVLNIDDQFIDGLPSEQRRLLARQVAARLAAGSGWLGYDIDLDLEAFTEGGNPGSASTVRIRAEHQLAGVRVVVAHTPEHTVTAPARRLSPVIGARSYEDRTSAAVGSRRGAR